MATISDENNDEIVDENGFLIADTLSVVIWGPDLSIEITNNEYSIEIE